ncbi:MAG: hypothetical protein GY835_22370 [bacterium]|nr:hypothetical protein [bacterium]
MRWKHATSFMIAIAALAAFSLAALFAMNWRSLESEIGPTVFRLAFQFLLFVILGGGVSIILRKFAFDREVREAQRSLRLTIYQNLVQAFHRGRSVRRLIRARALVFREVDTPQDVETRYILKDPYDRQMVILNEVLSDFELHRHEILAHKDEPNTAEIARHLEIIEEFPGAVVREYQNKLRHFSKEAPPSMPLPNLPSLETFLYDVNKRPDFRTRFTEPFYNALELLREMVVR